MGMESLKLIPGVNQNETQALNEAGITASNLIRFAFDKKGLALIQKLGGWQKFFSQPASAIVRALCAWEDANAELHLAIGTENAGGQTTLSVITNGAQANITPRSSSDNIPPAASTTAGSAVVSITDNVTEGITSYDSVYIQTHMSVGGLVLFGLYPCVTLGTDTYDIIAVDQFGDATPAPSTSTAVSLASFTTANQSNVITVTLPNHGFQAGVAFPVLVRTTVGGVSLYGAYTIQSVVDANTFTFYAATQATSAATATINGGQAAMTYSYGVGAVPPGTGYGVGGYGRGGYGSGTAIQPSLGSPIAAYDWTLDNWGPILVACPINGTAFQPIYVWDPASGSPTATIIPQAPAVNDGVFVAMPSRQIVAWGSTDTGIQDPLMIRWCDVLNYGVWAGTAINQAGKWRIAKGSKIVGGMQGPQNALIWTDIDLWTMTYIGGELVYSFDEVGSGCGLIGRKAAGALGEEVFWMGQSQFYVLSGGGVSILPCDIWDVVFQNLDTENTYKIRCAVNSRFNEVFWFFPTLESGGEVAMYVKYNALLKVWDYGVMARSAWIDQSVLGPPIAADPGTLYVYQHETSPDADGQPLMASFTTGYAVLEEGDFLMFVDRVWPDMKWGPFNGAQNATIQITFLVCDYPGDTPKTFGPFSVTQATEFINPRLRGRLVAMQVSSNDIGSFWRLGNIRYRSKPDGKREN